MKYKITPFVVGIHKSPEARLVYLGDPEKTITTINSFFLLEGRGKNILIDVGFTEKFCKKFTDEIKQEEDQDPLLQLKSVGIYPGDIDDIIITHVHFDHLSDVVNEFKNASIHIQNKEFEFTMNPPHPWFQEFIDIDLLNKIAKDKSSDLNLIDGECELFPGVKVITTPGHTAGHQSVLVETEFGEFCITGDAVLNYINLEKDIGPGFNTNLVESMQSLQKIRDLSDRGVTILAGHDPKMLEYLHMEIPYGKN